MSLTPSGEVFWLQFVLRCFLRSAFKEEGDKLNAWNPEIVVVDLRLVRFLVLIKMTSSRFGCFSGGDTSGWGERSVGVGSEGSGV
jgi:acetoacetate decarboxylase